MPARGRRRAHVSEPLTAGATTAIMAQASLRRRLESTIAFLIYLSLALLVLGRGLAGHFTGVYIGQLADPPMFMWFLRWWRYVLDHRINPFLTDLVWAPVGYNLAWVPFVPLLGWIAIPIGRWAGETAAYNTLCIAALPAAAIAAFLLCRRIAGAFWPALLGGYLFGFSPYMLGHVLAHLHMIGVFPIPLIVLAALRRLDGETSAQRFTIELAALLTAQFLLTIELFATLTVFGAIAIAVAAALFGPSVRARLIGLAAPIVLGYAIAMAVLSPYLYYLFALGIPHYTIFDPARFSADVLNLVVPTSTMWLGEMRFARGIAGRFSFGGVAVANTAYAGLPLLVIVELYRRRSGQTPSGKFLVTMAAIVWIASLGPILHLGGRSGIPMPWALTASMPLLSDALPERFSLYLFLLLAVIVADWFARAQVRPAMKHAAAAVVIVSLLPNPSASFWTTPLNLPAFFTDGTCQRDLKPREIILPLPFGPKSGGMYYWQARTGMYFRMATGWMGLVPFEFDQMPLGSFVYGAIDLPEAADQFKAYAARFGVGAIVADTSDERWQVWKRALAPLGPPELTGGVALYRIAPGFLSAYANLPAAAVEARAAALRFDFILEAAGKYLAAGRAPSALAPAALANAKLLPQDWEIDPRPDAYADWGIAPLSGDRIGIVVSGTRDAMMPLVERYRRYAVQVLCPAPKPWSPGTSLASDRRLLLMLTFDRAGLKAAAADLKSSPPPERTTPFLTGVMSWQPPQ